VIGALVRLLRPAIEPILKLRFDPPHLPEGGAAPRPLRPSEGYLAYRYTGAILALAPQLVAAGISSTLAVWRLGGWGWLIAVPVSLIALAAAAFTLVGTRLDWELRWYAVGEQSMRLCAGAWTQREITLSYANVQNVEVTQGPFERLFGFQSLRVTTAGGGARKGRPGESSHEALLAGLTDAPAIRDRVLSSLRRRRDTGLGDPDELDATLLGEIRDAARALHAAAALHSPPR
jgi:membrane protein YdbS with pleckstrin-like domain